MISTVRIEGNCIYAAICTAMLQHYFPDSKIIYEDFLILPGIKSAKPSFLQAIKPFTNNNFNFDLHEELVMQDWITIGQSYNYVFGQGLEAACSFDQANLFSSLKIKPSSVSDKQDFLINFNSVATECEKSNILTNIDYELISKNKSILRSTATPDGWVYSIPYKSKSIDIVYSYNENFTSSFKWPKVFLTQNELNLNINILELHPVKSFIYIFLIKLFINYLVKFTKVDEHFIRNYNLYSSKLLHGVNAYLSAHIVFSQRFENFFSKHDRQNSSWNELLVESQFRDDGNIFGPKDWNLLAKNLKVN